jgi:hypothetical protein
VLLGNSITKWTLLLELRWPYLLLSEFVYPVIAEDGGSRNHVSRHHPLQWCGNFQTKWMRAESASGLEGEQIKMYPVRHADYTQVLEGARHHIIMALTLCI